MTDKKSIWDSPESCGWKEVQQRKAFYGHTCSIQTQGGGELDMQSLSNAMATEGVFLNVISDSLYIPVSRFSTETMERYDSYSKDSLKYLDKGLEAFDIY